jgi:hypothetical protein
MSKRFFVDDELAENGKYRVLQEDSETKECFGVKDFDTREEAQRNADDLQKAVDNALSERTTGDLSENPLSNSASENQFKDTLQNLKSDSPQE